MVIRKLCIEDILPLMKHKAIFWDVPRGCPKELIIAAAIKRRMNIIGVKEGSELIHAAWTFQDDHLLKVAPKAKEFGNWYSKKGKNTIEEFSRRALDILFSDGTRELFGFALSINIGQINLVKWFNGQVYYNFGEVKCFDGVKRGVVLNVLTRAKYYRLKDEEEYSPELYRVLLPV